MELIEKKTSVSLTGSYFNTGNGPTLQPIDIGHPAYIGLIDPDTAFWSLIKKERLADAFTDGPFQREYMKKLKAMTEEMQALRFGLKPSAVYFNPTERCNLNCTYCYLPEKLRKYGRHMSRDQLLEALGILKAFFEKTTAEGRIPQIIFHGSEPMLNRDAIFEGIEQYKDDFHFGVQTNGTLFDEASINFLKEHGVGIGMSLDGPNEEIADRTRKTWGGKGVFKKVVESIEMLNGYPNYNVICTVTKENVRYLPEMVEFFHSMKVPGCMLNPVRCTQPGARDIKPRDSLFIEYYFKAIDRGYELYKKTGQKLVIANFANILLSIVAPLARRLMCDISPCGGGRCFFAVSANGDVFPCSEFIGIPEFNGGNLFKGEIDKALSSDCFKKVTGRIVEEIEPCKHCAIRHFCGAPCPAEAYTMNRDINRPGAFCEFYEEQAKYAFRLIAEGKEDAFLWDDWDEGTVTTLRLVSI